MMDLDSAIQHCEEMAYQKDLESGFETDNERYAMTDKERADCKECAEEHRQLAEWLKELEDYRKTWDEIKKQIKEESNFAYADFGKYKYEVLGVDDIDELPDDDFRYGMERALEIINEYIRVVKE